jgi:hypothetical protein
MFNLPDRRFVRIDKPIVRFTLHMYRFVRAQDGTVLKPILDLGNLFARSFRSAFLLCRG